MKLLNVIATSLIATFILTPVAQAKPLYGQAGRIEDGAPYFLKKIGDTASYYKEGKSGSVMFSCELYGEGKMLATLTGGKNLIANIPATLKGGYSFHKWELRDTGEDVGNIKVTLLMGKNAEVTCKMVD